MNPYEEHENKPVVGAVSAKNQKAWFENVEEFS